MKILTHESIVNQMYQNDAFSQWLGIKIISADKGSCILKMKITSDMTNGFNIAHGGITYALADSALAFASNSQGKKAVSIETSISHLKPVFIDDVLTAKVKEISKSHKLATYQVEIKNQKNELVAVFKGTVYRKSENWSSKG